jgi:hypothetical protein
MKEIQIFEHFGFWTISIYDIDPITGSILMRDYSGGTYINPIAALIDGSRLMITSQAIGLSITPDHRRYVMKNSPDFSSQLLNLIDWITTDAILDFPGLSK